MAVNGGPKIPKDGLVLSLDFANFKSNRGRRSLINWNSWTSGSGGASPYAQNGPTAENRRIWDTNPFGNIDIVWDTPSNDVNSDGDGGWNYNYIPIDPTKMYRHSVWIRRPTIGNGSSYLGTYAFEDTTNVGVYFRSNGTTSTTNPYFRSSSWWGSANTWYLMVGHTWPFGSGAGSIHEDTGVWTVGGTRTTTCTDFIWKTANTNKTSHRSYLYYSTDTSTNQQWYQPRIDLCDGTEPTLQELLNDVGNKITDISYNGNDFTLTGSVAIDSDNLGSYHFDGENDYMRESISHSYLSSSAIEVWFKQDAYSSGKKYLAGYRHNSGYSLPTIGSIYIAGTTVLASLITTTEVYRQVSTTRSSATELTHVVFNKDVDNGIMELYLNGNLVSSNTFDKTTYAQWTTAGNYIGANIFEIGKSTNDNSGQGWGSDHFDGKIYSVRVYGKVLDSSQVKQLYNSQRGRFGL